MKRLVMLAILPLFLALMQTVGWSQAPPEPPFGFIACDTASPVNPCVTAGFTLFHPYFASVLSIEDQIEGLRAAKDAGVLDRYMVPTPHDGPTGYPSYLTYFQALRAHAEAEGLLGWRGLHHRDEAGNLALTKEIYDAYHAVFPNSFTVLYGQDENGADWAQATDVAAFSGYTDYHDRPTGWVFFNLAHNAANDYGKKSTPSWLEMGREVWLTTEGFDDATIGEPLGSTACTRPDAYERAANQVIQGILGGATGIYSYAGVYTYQEPCLSTVWQAHRDMFEILKAIWPLEGREKVSITVLSGSAEACSGPELEYIICDTAVVAFRFGDRLIVGSLLGQEADGEATAVSVPGDWTMQYGSGVSGLPSVLTVEPYGWAIFQANAPPTATATATSTPTATMTPVPTVTPVPPTATPTPEGERECQIRARYRDPGGRWERTWIDWPCEWGLSE